MDLGLCWALSLTNSSDLGHGLRGVRKSMGLARSPCCLLPEEDPVLGHTSESWKMWVLDGDHL